MPPINDHSAFALEMFDLLAEGIDPTCLWYARSVHLFMHACDLMQNNVFTKFRFLFFSIFLNPRSYHHRSHHHSYSCDGGMSLFLLLFKTFDSPPKVKALMLPEDGLLRSSTAAQPLFLLLLLLLPIMDPDEAAAAAAPAAVEPLVVVVLTPELLLKPPSGPFSSFRRVVIGTTMPDSLENSNQILGLFSRTRK